MSYNFRPVNWNAFTWIGVLLWLAVALRANVTWPIDRTAELQKVNNFRAETEKLHPDFAKLLPVNVPIRFSSGLPFTYVVRDLNTTIRWSFPKLVLNLLICVTSTGFLILLSQKFLHRYSVSFLLVATTIFAVLLAIGQFGARLVQYFGASTFLYYDSLFQIVFVSPIIVGLFLVARSSWLRQIEAEPSDRDRGRISPDPSHTT